ncbi:MAG TPA: hypothetical protein PLG77_16645, partial [Burkholderiaceae bacterium]|nr:hypothetical protein [Burkholderiaceae bacterium]
TQWYGEDLQRRHGGKDAALCAEQCETLHDPSNEAHRDGVADRRLSSPAVLLGPGTFGPRARGCERQ